MKRIEWIDMAKAFAIFCVVFGHVEFFSMGQYLGFFNRFQDLFCMPLFFFLSGMVAKPQQSLSYSFQCIKKKFLQLMVPFVVCGSIYVYLCYPDYPWWSLFWYPEGEAHQGYWFLLVLFEVYLLFSFVQWITNKLCQGRGFVLISFTIWIVLLLALVAGHYNFYFKEPLWTIISFHRIYNYFPFFILGHWLMQHRHVVERLLTAEAFTIATCLFVPLYVLRDRYEISVLPLNWLLALLAVFSIVYLFYRTSLTSTPQNGTIHKSIGFVGRHTLEIYVLHFFFIPKEMTWLNDMIAPHGIADTNILLELLICSTLASFIILVTLMCAWVLRNNRLLARIMLGDQ